jgi:IS30 family transposase
MTRYRQLTLEERYQIQAMLGLGICRAEIARQLGRHPSTIYRELARNTDPTTRPPYSPRRATKRLAGLRRRKGAASRKIQGALQELIEAKLRLSWSPEQVSGRLRRESQIKVSHETIYQHVLRDSTGLRYCLRFGGYKHHRFKKSKHAMRTALWRKLLEHRPKEANERQELGHWERDLVLGNNESGVAMLTIVDRRSRYTRLRRVKNKTAAVVGRQTLAALRPYGDLNKTITNDNGVEFQKGVEFERESGVPIFYTDPGAPWQRGTVENMNGLVRQYFPKGSPLDKFPTWFETAIEDTLNHRPRKTLYYRTPHEVFFEEQYELLSPDVQLGLEFSSIS